MPKLPKYTLNYDDGKRKWVLKEDRTTRVVKSFKIKEDATADGVLKKALGQEGGSVKIKTIKERYQEERTFPRTKDPRTSKG